MQYGDRVDEIEKRKEKEGKRREGEEKEKKKRMLMLFVVTNYLINNFAAKCQHAKLSRSLIPDS